MKITRSIVQISYYDNGFISDISIEENQLIVQDIPENYAGLTFTLF